MTDKTGKIAILDKSDYINKMENTIKEINVDIMNQNPLRKLTEKVKILLKSTHWPKNKPPLLINHAPNIPRLFGKFKDHKTPPKFRPIVNRREGPTYDIEVYMTNIYKEILPPSDHSLNSTADFIKRLRSFEHNSKDKIVSFDVINLYPSIDINEIQEIINQRIEHLYGRNDISQTIISASNLILNEAYFTFNRKIYKQKKGVPMGSPVASVIAELKLRLVENKICEKFRNKIIWLRYVDDIYAVITEEHEPDEILRSLNEIDQNIQFTLETKINGTINFLDVTVKKQEENITTTVHRKPNSSTEIINNRCNTPFQYKLTALRSYINDAILICSSDQLLKEEIKFIMDIAENAGYKKNTR